jgi:A/G-specific adenine glycosylase
MEKWFSEGLIKWYNKNKRDLPWRQETDPYKIWLSEIILQQTQVAQGLSYYLKFTECYPTVKKLALAKEDEVLKLWQGLGYYSRARNLHETAKKIHTEYKGTFPASFEEIKALKGIGDYTAAAIASFAYNLPHAVVDGNVYRVLSRVFGIKTPIDASQAKKEFQNLANQLIDTKKPAQHNQAIMEFGSQFCKPANPNCETCIFRNRCFAFANKLVAELPIKSKKIKIKNRYFNYLVVIDKREDVLVHKRTKKDIWEGLYEFVLIETPEDCTLAALQQMESFKSLLKTKYSLLYTSHTYKHVLSHQHLYAKFYVIKSHSAFKNASSKTALENVKKLAFPRLIEKFLNDCDLKEIV